MSVCVPPNTFMFVLRFRLSRVQVWVSIITHLIINACKPEANHLEYLKFYYKLKKIKTFSHCFFIMSVYSVVTVFCIVCSKYTNFVFTYAIKSVFCGEMSLHVKWLKNMGSVKIYSCECSVCITDISQANDFLMYLSANAILSFSTK